MAITEQHDFRCRGAMKTLLLGAAFVVGLAAVEGDASAGLAGQPIVRAGTVHGSRTLARAKKKKKASAASPGKSDSDDAGSTDDDASGKSASASSGGGDDAASEDELLGSKKKAPARAAASDTATDSSASDDNAGARKASAKSVETVSATASPEETSSPSSLSALEFGVGAKALFRNFGWTADGRAAGLGPYSLTPGPETGLWLELYPAALGTSGFAANVGIIGQFDYGFGVATTLANHTDVSTTFRDFLGGLKVRIPLGTFIPNVSVAYGQQVFAVAQQQNMMDLPQLAYSFVRPALGTRVLFSPEAALDVTAGYLAVLDPGSGANQVRSTRFFPKTTAYGIDVSASVSYRITGAIGARGGVDWRQYGLNLNPDSTTRSVAGAVDRYITAWAGVEVVLGGQGAAAGGDDEPVKPSKRKRRHAEPKPDDESESGDDSKPEAE
jgi:hypothetical protein